MIKVEGGKRKCIVCMTDILIKKTHVFMVLQGSLYILEYQQYNMSRQPYWKNLIIADISDK